ncbi:MAG: carbohydrate ABC transporter permease [Peptostreptococcaceae bacterium]|nr:carbohydrate ABC transporter permease [Peptostreptococcaceae bacterium]
MVGKNKTGIAFKYLFAILFALMCLFPVFVLFNTALKPFSEVKITHMWVLPTTISFDGFREAFVKLGGNFKNSFLLVIPVCTLSIFFGSVCGFIFSKIKFKFSNVIFAFFIFGMFIPYQSILIPLVQTLRKMGLYGSIAGLIFTHTVYGLPISTLMFRNYYSEVPDELIEAGVLDGLSIWGAFRHLIVPISIPSVIVVLIWQFTSVWNDFLFAVIITQDSKIQPITVALQNLAGSQVVEWNIQMAGAIVAALPPLLVYIFFGKYFVQGLMAGSVKG